jgi:uroporphyrinogen decarboxylase
MMFNPAIFRKHIKPRTAKLFDIVKSSSRAKIVFHSCGAISEIIDDLIEIGVDAINPVQVNAVDMEPRSLKARFGDRVTFWGGIDSQKTLPFGTTDEVQREVKRIIEILGKHGGYVLSAVHNIRNEVGPENVIAMFTSCRKYGRYER